MATPFIFDMPWSDNPGRYSNLFKSGRSTGFTKGMYSGLRQVVIAKGLDLHGEEASLPTFEHAIARWSYRPIAESGDSGAFVYTFTGEVVGLLVGSWERMDVAVFQYIFDVFEDIKMVTGAVDVRIALG